MDCFELMPGEKFFKKNLADGRPVKKEILLAAVCPNCRHYILKFLWYGRKNTSFKNWDDEKIIRGKQADEIFDRRQALYNMIDLPNPFKPKSNSRQSKKLAWVYGKTLNGTAQVPRYIDETEDAGLKINCPVKIYK